MLGSLSFAPGLAVAGVTTSVSLAAAMGGVQGLPPEASPAPTIRTMAEPVEPAVPSHPVPVEAPTAAPQVVDTSAPAATPEPTPAPAAPPAVVAAAPAPKPTSKPATAPPPPPPASSNQCWSWSGEQWNLTWCAPTSPGGTGTWTASNGTSTYSGTSSGVGGWSGGGGAGSGSQPTKTAPPGHPKH